LNDLIFAVVPVLIAPDDDAADVRAEIAAHWPQRNANLLRYYGMGFDAYRLVGPLFSEDQAAWPMRGLSGDLSLDAQGRVRRVLPLAQFRNGRPVAYEVVPPDVEASGLIGQR
jgi:outer membrane PBP1 activator LpoA protein